MKVIINIYLVLIRTNKPNHVVITRKLNIDQEPSAVSKKVPRKMCDVSILSINRSTFQQKWTRLQWLLALGNASMTYVKMGQSVTYGIYDVTVSLHVMTVVTSGDVVSLIQWFLIARISVTQWRSWRCKCGTTLKLWDLFLYWAPCNGLQGAAIPLKISALVSLTYTNQRTGHTALKGCCSEFK